MNLRFAVLLCLFSMAMAMPYHSGKSINDIQTQNTENSVKDTDKTANHENNLPLLIAKLLLKLEKLRPNEFRESLKHLRPAVNNNFFIFGGTRKLKSLPVEEGNDDIETAKREFQFGTVAHALLNQSRSKQSSENSQNYEDLMKMLQGNGK